MARLLGERSISTPDGRGIWNDTTVARLLDRTGQA